MTRVLKGLENIMNIKLILFIFSLSCVSLLAAEKHPFTAEDLVTMQRISSVTLSPDGRYVAYVLRSTDMDANKGTTDLWVRDLKNNTTQQLTEHKASDGSPAWAKDSRTLYFLSSRSDSSQVWKIDVDDKSPVQVTDFELDVSSFKLSPENDRILFSASVVPSCDSFACTKAKEKAQSSVKESGVVYEQMFVRHWDHWIGQTQSQLFVAELDKKGKASKKVISISSSVNANVPSDPFGGSEEYTFDATGNDVYFAARLQDGNEPISTNFDIYRVSIAHPEKATNLTKENPAWDTLPVISHDGKKMAWLAMQRPGFEADRFEVKIRDLQSGKVTRVTQQWDRSFSNLEFSADDQFLFLTGNHLGTNALWRLEIATGKTILFNKEGYVSGVSVGKDKLVYAKDSLKSPTQLFVSDLEGKESTQITFHNQEKLEAIAFGDYEQFQFKGWNNETVHGYVVKPANFKAGKKYPLAFLIHGGPQGSFGDHFHYRWNPQTYTGQGFVAVMIDFHGSTGYGQAFTDSISQNWGSKPFVDLQKGLEHVVSSYDFIDGDNVCALGASYGGYMINWIAGNWPKRFKCLVNHDGVFDNRMMYYATEELWFTEWENGGPYFAKPEQHEKFNPVNFVDRWQTPMMVIQGELDYRIPVTQGLATFTALQRKGIKSKLLYFPDENHWVLKPANSIQWHREVNQWLHEFLD